MLPEDWFQVKQISDSVLCIEEPLKRLFPDFMTDKTNIYVIYDKYEALILDTGSGLFSIKEYVEKLLGKRTVVTPLITHNHFDHVGSLNDFPYAFIHDLEVEKLQKSESLHYIKQDIIERKEEFIHLIPENFEREVISTEFHRVADGEWLAIGKKELQIIHLPGHSKGSLGLWYPEENFYFVGDAFQTGYVYADEDPISFLKSLEKMALFKTNTFFMSAHEKLYLQQKDLEDLIQDFYTLKNQNFNVDSKITNKYLNNPLFMGKKFSIILPPINDFIPK